jgi:hypothetical protein
MNKYSIIFTVLCLFALPVLHAQDKTTPESQTAETDGLSIVVTSLKADNKILQIDYEVVNNSEDDAWIFKGTR